MWKSMSPTGNHNFPPTRVIHALTKGATSSPAFFFWRSMTTSGTMSLGVPIRRTFGRTLAVTLDFALPSLVDLLDLWDMY